MNVPVLIRLSSIEAWRRFADVGGFDAVTENGATVSEIPFGGGGAARLREERSRFLRYHGSWAHDERTQDIVRRLEAGETLAQASKPWGITRERARQIAARWFSLNKTSLGEIRQAQRKKKQDAAAFALLVQAPLCAVCNEPVLRGSKRRTCSPECGEEYTRHMWRYNEERRRACRLGTARYVLAHAERHTDATIAYARRVVADPAMPFNRRYTLLNHDERRRAADALRQLLASGPRARNDVAVELERQGIAATESALDRLRRDVGVVSKRRGFGPGGVAIWSLPDSQDGARPTRALKAEV